MKKRLLIFISFLLFFQICIGTAFADVYFPPACRDNEEYFELNDIDPTKYSNIRRIKPYSSDKSKSGPVRIDNNYFYDGYCVDRSEYCRNNICGIDTKLKSIDFLGIIPVLINFVLNCVIIVILMFLSDRSATDVFEPRSVIKIFFISILGYLADIFSIFIVGEFFVRQFCWMGGELCGDVWYKSSLTEFILTPIFLYLFPIILIIIFLLVMLIFYNTYSYMLTDNKRGRVRYSIIFGILSNPVWYYVFRLLIY